MKTLSVKSALVLIASTLVLTGCELSSKETVQRGYRGTGMELVINENMLNDQLKANQPPAPQPAASSAGPKARDIYQNVQVLGDLSVAEFTRLICPAPTPIVAPAAA